MALLTEAIQFLNHSVSVAKLPILGDAHLFFAMGRGWLNGLVFYKDLFETKPPLIFLLAAFSLKLTGGNLTYKLVELMFLGLLGPALGLFGYYAARNSSDRWLRAGLSLLLGLAAAGYTLRWNEDFQAEGFGVLFAVLPSLLVGRALRWDISAGIFLGLATMLKEPFCVAGAMALLVFHRDRSVVRVLAFAGVTCLGILFLAQAIVPYFTIYLPEMFSGRSIASSVYTHYGLGMRFAATHPLWLRSLNAYRIFREFGTPLSSICLGGFLLAACILWIESERPRRILLGAALLGTMMLSAHMFDLTEQLIALIHRQGQSVPWGHPIILRLLALMSIPTALVSCWAWRAHAPWSFYRRLLILLAGLFLASALVNYGGGDYDHRYLVFALPFLLAVSLNCLVQLKSPYVLLLGGLLVLNSALPGRYKSSTGPNITRSRVEESLQAERDAKTVDALLTTCGFPRYFAALDTISLQSHTEHSPYQINYGIERALGGLAVSASAQTPNTYLAKKLRVDLQEASIMILPSEVEPGALPEALAQAVQARTQAAPACAQPFLPIPGLSVLF